jgi:hypothetical protein
LSGVSLESLKRYERSGRASPVHLGWLALTLSESLNMKISIAMLLKD